MYSVVPAPESAANRRSALLSASSPAVLSSALQHPFWGDVSPFSRCEAAFLKTQTRLNPPDVHGPMRHPVRPGLDYPGTGETPLGALELGAIYSSHSLGLSAGRPQTRCGRHPHRAPSGRTASLPGPVRKRMPVDLAYPAPDN